MDILFDFDGTIISPFLRIYTIYQDLTKKYTLSQMSYEEYITQKKNRIPETTLLGHCTDTIKNSYQEERMRLIEDPYYLSMDTLYPHAKETLRKLHTIHTLHLISIRKKEALLLQQLRHHKLLDYFKTINSPKTKDLEDDPIMMKFDLAKALKNKDKKQVVVGDTEVDTCLGKKLGALTIAVDYGMRTKEYLNTFNPDYVIANLSDLAEILVS